MITPPRPSPSRRLAAPALARRRLGAAARPALWIGAALLLLLPPGRSMGRPRGAPPDLFVAETRDWRIVLPASTVALRADPRHHLPLLLHEEGKEPWTRHFVARYQPHHPVVLGPPEAKWAGPSAVQLGEATSELRGDAQKVLKALIGLSFAYRPKAAPFVVVDDRDYPMALHAATLAGLRGGLLLPVGPRGLSVESARRLLRAHASEVVVAGPEALASALGAGRDDTPLVHLAEAEAVAEESARWWQRARHGPVRHLVVTNPADTQGYFSPPHLSLLAPFYAVSRGGTLLTTGADPEEIAEAVAAFEATHGPVTHITFVGDYLALGMKEMVDPDQVYSGVEHPRRFKIPLLAGLEHLEPAAYAVARLAAEDVYDLSYQVGRIVAPERTLTPRREALILSNADLKFIVAELVSMVSAKELENVGYAVHAYYGRQVNRELVRAELPGKHLIVWHGHPRDLTVDYEIGVVDQRLDAGLVVLQGCYTLDRNDPYVMVQQGAAAVVGTYMAVYSASGSAFAKTFLDAMLYHDADLGEAMVHARNYLLAYVALKRRRGHDDWRKTYRAALSFDLWGDPTARPVAPLRTPAHPPVRLERRGQTLRFVLPERPWGTLAAGRYRVDPTPGAELGAIYTRKRSWGDVRRLQEMYFGWVELPDLEGAPKLRTAIPDRDWASVYVPARHRLYLLVHNDAAEALRPEGLSFMLER